MNYRGRFREGFYNEKKGTSNQPLWYVVYEEGDTSRYDLKKVDKVIYHYKRDKIVFNVMSLIDSEALVDAWFSLKPYNDKDLVNPSLCNVDKLAEIKRRDFHIISPGIDGVYKHEFGYIDPIYRKPNYEFECNVKSLLDSLKDGLYYHERNLRVTINNKGKKRTIGIACFKDKLIERAVVDLILNPIYEQVFVNNTYAYRPNRNCKEAIKEVTSIIKDKNINYVIDADIKSFFDFVNHQKLIEMLELIIKDKKFIRYIRKVLKAGYQDSQGNTYESKRGVPQGGIISPILANVYLHYVLDSWFYELKLNGNGELVRYADDFILMFENKEDCDEVYKKLIKRFKEFGLKLSLNKTRVIDTYMEDINFLGFRVYRDSNFNARIEIDFEKVLKRSQMMDTLVDSINKDYVKYEASGRELLFYGDYIRMVNNRLIGIYKYFYGDTKESFIKNMTVVYNEVLAIVQDKFGNGCPGLTEDIYNMCIDHLMSPVDYCLEIMTRKRR